MVARRPPPVSDSDTDADRERGRRLRRLEGEEMARAAAELRACAQRLPPESRSATERDEISQVWPTASMMSAPELPS